MNKNDKVILDITAVSTDGYGIGKAEDGTAVFVPLAAVGDRVEATIVKVMKNYCFGKLINIITPSSDRTDPDCEVFLRCGGCCYRHISYDAELKIKQQRVCDAIERIGGIDVHVDGILGDSSRRRYRNKGQFPVARTPDGKATLGLFALHSHRVIPCTDCMLQPPEFTPILDEIVRYINDNRIPVYDETSHTGVLRHVYLRASKDMDIMVCLVINAERLPKEMEKDLCMRMSAFDNVKTVVLNINKKQTGVILGQKCRVLSGDGYLTDTLCGIKIRLSPLSFYQVNHDMAEKLYNIAGDFASLDGKTLLDLYCGAGTIGLSLAHRAARVIGVEINESAVKDACRNAAENGIYNAEFICADAADAAKKLANAGEKADVIILDPPRKGADKSLIETICTAFCPENVVYVSCDPATLARDLKIFDTYGYKTMKVRPVDMFPGTAHVETVALLGRE